MGKIVLSGKFNMPIEYVAGYKGKKGKTRSTSSVVSSSSLSNKGDMYSTSRNKLIDLVETHMMEKKMNEMTMDEKGGDEEEEIQDKDSQTGAGRVLEKSLLRKETPEEKRERKARVKAER